MAAQAQSFHYARSCDLSIPVRVRIGQLEGPRPRPSYKELCQNPQLRFSGLFAGSDGFVTCQVFGDSSALALATQTTYRAFSGKAWDWNEWLTLPVNYKDLTRSACIACTVWDVSSPRHPTPVGGATLKLFGDDGTMQEGTFTLRLWEGRSAEGAAATPGYSGGELERLEQLIKQQSRQKHPHLQWLDDVSLQKIDAEKQKEKAKSASMFLTVELLRFDVPVVYCEIGGDLPTLTGGIADPELLFTENLVESKHHKLTRSRRRGPLDRDLKPNPATRDLLTRIARKAPTEVITPEEKDHLWRYRYFLTREKKALTKFLKCVDWNDPVEAKQATEVMDMWEAIDVDDALELLGPHFLHPAVRSYAVSCLEKASNDDLLLYLLQLVQALKYEGLDELEEEPQLDNNQADEAVVSRKPQTDAQTNSLEKFLIKRAVGDPKLGHFFFWYLTTEVKDNEKKDARKYGRIWNDYNSALGKAEMFERLQTQKRQGEFLAEIRSLAKEVKSLPINRKKKIERLHVMLQESHQLNTFPPMALPLDPDVVVTGIIPERGYIFKSALTPLGLTFRTQAGGEYGVIFKLGDDLRQDQLVIQIITLMDQLLKKESLDLKLTPYCVLATSAHDGFVQFIPESPAIANVLSDHGSVQNYFRKHHLDEKAPYKINKDVMETYIKSCAGYCVITFLLGVGDRHLDNLLLRADGHLFHIDFGFILGRDPKPYPPPFKLSKEMVEGMGGVTSDEMRQFRSHCYNAFLILRKNANLILNLFSMMVDSNVRDIAIDPDKTVMKVQEKFRLDLSEEQAVKYFQEMMDESVSALFAQFVEKVHSWAQYWRK